MQYIIAGSQTASRHGFKGAGYPEKNGFTCINEKDLASCRSLEGSLRQRADSIGGTIVSRGEALEFLNGKP